MPNKKSKRSINSDDTTTQSTIGSTAPKLSLWKKLVFTVLAAALCFLAIEIVLMLVSQQPVLYQNDPYVSLRVEHLIRGQTTAYIWSQQPTALQRLDEAMQLDSRYAELSLTTVFRP